MNSGSKTEEQRKKGKNGLENRVRVLSYDRYEKLTFGLSTRELCLQAWVPPASLLHWRSPGKSVLWV